MISLVASCGFGFDQGIRLEPDAAISAGVGYWRIKDPKRGEAEFVYAGEIH